MTICVVLSKYVFFTCSIIYFFYEYILLEYKFNLILIKFQKAYSYPISYKEYHYAAYPIIYKVYAIYILSLFL